MILTTRGSASAYPDPLRRVTYCDLETGKRLKFLTNNFALPALTIAQIYKRRWEVELFFRWIKHAPAHQGVLRNQRKRGQNPDLDRRLGLCTGGHRAQTARHLEASLYQLLQVFSVTLFEKTPILQALQLDNSQNELYDSCQPVESIRLLTGQP